MLLHPCNCFLFLRVLRREGHWLQYETKKDRAPRAAAPLFLKILNPAHRLSRFNIKALGTVKKEKDLGATLQAIINQLRL